MSITPPVVNLTAPAAQRVLELQSNDPARAAQHLRVYIEPGGCSGMQYGMVFDERRDGDLISESHGVQVLTDPVSAEHLRGLTVDFADGLEESGFKITNPNARESCGCGRSFGV